MVDIKKLFYEEIIKEAANGKVRILNYNAAVAFSTDIRETGLKYECVIDDELIPTLVIKDKKNFDLLLDEYVRKALSFYDSISIYDNENITYREKTVIVNLFSNATSDDFSDPVRFLKKRIAFFDNYFEDDKDLGYSNILQCNLELVVTKDVFSNEVPSQFVVRASSNNDIYVFPRVKFGINGDTVYIYAIQNEDYMIDNSLSKKIGRKLYKIGEGFTSFDGEENPKDITASFLVVLNMAINYFKSLGYTKFVVPSILPVRWNAKVIVNKLKHDKGKINDLMYSLFEAKQEKIQNNLTNKLIRTFMRLRSHYNNIVFSSLPYDVDSCLHMEIDTRINEECNNSLLFEVGMMASTRNKKVK